MGANFQLKEQKTFSSPASATVTELGRGPHLKGWISEKFLRVVVAF